MQFDYHRKFKKAFRKQPKKIQEKFFEVLEIFKVDPFHPSLNNHALGGDLSGTRSFDVTGDVRVHYKEHNGGAMLMKIGTHSQLYG